jgi:transcription initiation factor TFIIE subunit alpha
MGDGDDNVRKRRREKLKDMQQRIEVSIQLCLELLMSRVKF